MRADDLARGDGESGAAVTDEEQLGDDAEGVGAGASEEGETGGVVGAAVEEAGDGGEDEDQADEADGVDARREQRWGWAQR